MSRRTSNKLSGIFTATLLVLLIACSDSTTEPTPVDVAQIVVTPNAQSMTVGDAVTLHARAVDAGGQTVDGITFEWSSSDQSVATVSSSGVVSAAAAGQAMVRARAEGKEGSTAITVALAPVGSITITPPAATLGVGFAVELVATLRDAAGRELTGRVVTWASTEPSVASVDAAGRLIALAEGESNVSASSEGKQATIAVTVTRAAVHSISVSPGPSLIEIGETKQFTAVVKDALGNVLTDRVVDWSVDNAAARITPDGKLTGRSNGYVTVFAKSEGVTAAVGSTIVVEEEPPAFDLIYSRSGNGGASELFVLPLGSPSQPIKVNAGNVSRGPTASPDGQRIAFAVSMDLPIDGRVDDIYAVDRNGLNMKRLTTAPGFDESPDWSPDGTRIVYTHWEVDGRSDIWIMNADGSNPMNLTAGMSASASRSSPEWSRDGTRIAFAQSQSGLPGTEASIWSMRADGSDEQQHTSTFSGFDASPTWSPDGNRIAFVRYYGGDADVTIVDIRDGSLLRVYQEGIEQTPAWSPDGAHIAFAHLGDSNIHTMRSDGTQMRIRTVEPTWGGGYGPSWIKRN